MAQAIVYLIPVVLHEDETALNCMPAYIVEKIKKCSVFFVENERTTRRFLKKIWKSIIIDDYEWHTIHKTNESVIAHFKRNINQEKTIGIMSEAGCPGIADPGQSLISIAHTMNARVIPLVGPDSILLALMASGMNGQCFKFIGYLPVNSDERKNKIYNLENESKKDNCTQIFIETPYRNNQLLNDILQIAKTESLLCIGIDITSSNESIQTKKIKYWKEHKPELHKRPAVFLLYAGYNQAK